MISFFFAKFKWNSSNDVVGRENNPIYPRGMDERYAKNKCITKKMLYIYIYISIKSMGTRNDISILKCLLQTVEG